jgi:hypothetical protein
MAFIDLLALLYALAWLGALAWLVYYGITTPAKPGDAPRLVVFPMLIGMMTFLYWIVTGKAVFGIDHIRPAGVPLGLWGFGLACVASLLLFVGRNRS